VRSLGMNAKPEASLLRLFRITSCKRFMWISVPEASDHSYGVNWADKAIQL
jgi:hypothetical protein